MMSKTNSVIPFPSPKLVKILLGSTLVLPHAWIAWSFFGRGVAPGISTANPAQELNHLFGRVGYYALALNLTIGSCLALIRILKKSWPRLLVPITAYRRHLGVAGVLFLVAHVALHFLIEAGLSEGFEAIYKAKYLWAGSAAFAGLLVLAFTSNNASVRALKKRWKTLHRAVYPLFFFASAHTLMIEKADLFHFGWIALATGAPLLIRFSRWFMLRRIANNASHQKIANKTLT